MPTSKECQLRKEELARIEQDPDWWQKREEEQRQRKKEREELQAKVAAMGYHSDPDPWKSSKQSEDALATLTRQIRDYKTNG